MPIVLRTIPGDTRHRRSSPAGRVGCTPGGWRTSRIWSTPVSQRHELLGHAGCVLRQVRDPWQLANALKRQRLHFPRPLRQPPAVGTGRCSSSRGGVAVACAFAGTIPRGSWSSARCRSIRSTPMTRRMVQRSCTLRRVPRLVFSALDPRSVTQRRLPGLPRRCYVGSASRVSSSGAAGPERPGFVTWARSDHW